jgi:hypothetical protein
MPITKIDPSWLSYGQRANVVMLRKKDQFQPLWPLYVSAFREIKKGKREVHEELVYIPSCNKILTSTGHGPLEFDEYLPVSLYTGWAADKIGDGKWDVIYTAMPLTYAIPRWVQEYSVRGPR